jgi:DNA-binding transcriptional MocR family regulator
MPVRLTLADQTVVAIEALLAVLPAGAVLPCEDALAVRFSVSRVTVRKALARLVARGMVAGGGRGKRRVVVGGAVGGGGGGGARGLGGGGGGGELGVRRACGRRW